MNYQKLEKDNNSAYKYNKESSKSEREDSAQKYESSIMKIDPAQRLEEAKLQMQKEFENIDQDSSFDIGLQNYSNEKNISKNKEEFNVNKIFKNAFISHTIDHEVNKNLEFQRPNSTRQPLLLTSENGNILTQSYISSINLGSNTQKSREKLQKSRILTNENSESFMNYSISDIDIEEKLKQSFANLRSNRDHSEFKTKNLHTYQDIINNKDLEEMLGLHNKKYTYQNSEFKNNVR